MRVTPSAGVEVVVDSADFGSGVEGFMAMYFLWFIWVSCEVDRDVHNLGLCRLIREKVKNLSLGAKIFAFIFKKVGFGGGMGVARIGCWLRSVADAHSWSSSAPGLLDKKDLSREERG